MEDESHTADLGLDSKVSISVGELMLLPSDGDSDHYSS